MAVNCWEQVTERMEQAFRSQLGVSGGLDHRLTAALKHVTAHPGSMVRANLCYLLSRDLGLAESTAKSLACGIEYLHTASLIFDDLPSMDDARLRRGAPCVHVLFGESLAVLAALALINRGYALLWDGLAGSSTEARDRAAKLIDHSLGLRGVTGGQAADLNHAPHRGKASRAVGFVAFKKTVPLLHLAVVLPGVLANLPSRQILQLRRWCAYRGLAYQALDDWKDLADSEQAFGKTIGRDRVRGRPNLLEAVGATEAGRRLARWNRLAEQARECLPGDERWRALDALQRWVPSSQSLPGSFSAAV